MNDRDNESLLSLKEVCRSFGISEATGRNWVRRGRLVPVPTDGEQVRFSKEQIRELKNEIGSQGSSLLKRRRNKGYVKGSLFCEDYLEKESENISAVKALMKALPGRKGLSEEKQRLLLAEAAISLILQRIFGEEEPVSGERSLTKDFLEGHLELGPWEILIRDLLGSERQRERILSILEKEPSLPMPHVTFREREDLLGLLYQSFRNLRSRKSEGAYYTPTAVVRRMVEQLSEEWERPGICVMDPCCGTGNFLIQLPDTVDPGRILGNDVDPVSAALTRINLALRYPETDPKSWKEQITCKDTLTRRFPLTPDVILGNPPWGSRLAPGMKTKLKKKYRTAAGGSVESSDVFLEWALSSLPEGGALAFVLPEAILQVRTHGIIRELLKAETRLLRLDFLGEVFHKVQCPCILLQLRKEKGKAFTEGMRVCRDGQVYTIRTEREMGDEGLALGITDPELEILNKLRTGGKRVTLEETCGFAMGIVTGDNRSLLMPRSKTDAGEPVIRGAEIEGFRIREPEMGMIWEPERYQQAAPEEIYRRSPKLIYRFIGDHPVTAVDRLGRLTLNSCNLILPGEDSLPCEYLAAVLNSRIAGWYWKKQYRTMKILRHHLESFPIPLPGARELERLVELARTLETENGDERNRICREMEEILMGLYGLSEEETRVIGIDRE